MHIRRQWKWGLLSCTLGGWLWQAGCVHIIQRELNVLLSPESSAGLVRQSTLVDIFGPGVLRLFQ